MTVVLQDGRDQVDKIYIQSLFVNRNTSNTKDTTLGAFGQCAQIDGIVNFQS